ncbi:MAG TPA: ABC transporter ATP-binding protein [Verrucomicrobiae bacterium]|nr:ABC transporter ATP-binding protein [Verrucomicrobiae bacterium]
MSANNLTNAQPDRGACAIALRNVSKHYRLWHGTGPGRWARLLQLFVTQPPVGEATRGVGEFFPALKNISFEVMPGESVGIIGRNGCGKSTLLQILAGIMKPTSGSGTVNGELATLLELGAGFHPDFSGRENVALNSAVMNLSRVEAQARMEKIEAFADIGRFMDEPIRTYSNGMLLRLGFACAVAVEPDVFLVDEALGVGDIFFQQKCYEYMREHMRGKTRVVVSHDMHAITTFCSRVLVLEAGELIFDGPPLQAVELYMKALHDSQAGGSRNGSDAGKNGPTERENAAMHTVQWRNIPAKSLGGIGDVQLTRAEVRVNGEPFTSVVKPGDVVSVRALIQCRETVPSVLFGYLLRDKTGMPIFGENSAGVAGGIVTAKAGQSEFAFEFSWPEVQPDDYFLTLGAGEGSDPIRHRIQCWAHNIHLFNGISPGKPVHCLFNNPLREFAFTPHVDARAETILSQP